MRNVPTFELKAFFNQPLAATARANLSPSFAEPLDTADLLALESDAVERLTYLSLSYGAAFGGPELRDAIAGQYTEVRAEQVIATTGADDALASLFMSTLQPGDRVIVQHPVYQPLTSVATWNGAEVVPWHADECDGWEPSLARLETLLRSKTRMVVVNFPHSPTGFLPDRAYLERLIAMTDAAGALLVCDEIYRGLPLGDVVEPPSVADLSSRAVVVSSVSKTYGMPGLRVGWLVTGNADVLTTVKMFRLHLNTFLAVHAELLAAIALRHTATIHARNRALAQANVEHLGKFLERQREMMTWVPPRAGIVAFLRWHGLETTSELSDRLLREHELLLAPSASFAGGEHHVRIGFGTATFSHALTLLDAALGSV